MTPEQIQQLIDQLMSTGEFLATEAYRLALRQVYVQAVHNMIWTAVLTVILYFGIKAMKHGWKMDEYDEWEPWVFLGGFSTLVSSILLPICLSTAISYLINPEWYAISLMLELVK